MRPMLASRGTRVPTGPEWMHEIKWDGMRVLAEVTEGRLRLWSRNENDVTVSFPELRGLGALGHDVVVDAEVVAMASGVPTFAALADRMHVGNAARAEALSRTNPVTLLAFDLLRLDGRDLTAEPLEVRRTALLALGIDDVHWQVPAVYDDGDMLLEATRQQGLEGIVSKKRTSRYHPGRRSPDWLKFAHRPTGSYVVGGWRPEVDRATRLGAVLVGEPADGGLVYRGRVGSGLAGKRAVALLEQLTPLAADTSPFLDQVPKVDAAGTRWVRPEVVVEVASLGLTGAGRLRQPSLQGVRLDLVAADLGPQPAPDPAPDPTPDQEEA